MKTISSLPVLFAAVALPSCIVVESDPATLDASAGASASVAAPSVRWSPVALTGGGEQMNLVVDGRSYFLGHTRGFHALPRGEFADWGVPASASVAAGYWEPDADEEDGSKIYAAVEGSNVVVYRGYIAPGDMHNVDWTRTKTIPF